MKIYVVRHGQTNSNVERIIDGCRRDSSLNEIGIAQAGLARELLKDVKFDAIICSPLVRTRQTADILNINNAPIIYDDRLLERDAGEFTGKSLEGFNMSTYWNYYDNTEYVEVEDIRVFFRRIYDYLDYLKIKYLDKTILLVTHGGVTKVIDCYFNGIAKDGDLMNVGLKNCEIANYEI